MYYFFTQPSLKGTPMNIPPYLPFALVVLAMMIWAFFHKYTYVLLEFRVQHDPDPMRQTGTWYLPGDLALAEISWTKGHADLILKDGVHTQLGFDSRTSATSTMVEYLGDEAKWANRLCNRHDGRKMYVRMKLRKFNRLYDRLEELEGQEAAA
jgi:hypothetical protein